MSKAIMEKLYRHNLCSVYLLPLLGISMFDFGEDNFVNCYVHPQGRCLFVEVKDLSETEDPYHNEHYMNVIETKDGRKLIQFSFPDKWIHTFQMYKQGKYSSFTEVAKAAIIQYSGLNWKVPTNKPTVTMSDGRLLALYRKERLRDVLAEELSVSTELLDGELIGIPKPVEYFELSA